MRPRRLRVTWSVTPRAIRSECDDLHMRLVDLEPGDARLEDGVLPVLRELRPHLTPATFTAVYQEGYPQGLRYLAVYDGDRCVASPGGEW